MSDFSDRAPLERFSNRAQDYANYRPTYPQAALDFIFAGMPVPGRLRIADIGAGTGISSRLLAQRGASVVAIEPNDAMRAAARRHTRVRFAQGTAEATGLPASSVNLVTAFQSFHWFAQQAALAEFARILKRRGRVALIWNNRLASDRFSGEYEAFLDTFGEEAAAIQRGRGIGPIGESLQNAGFLGVARAEFPHFQRMDWESFLGRARSSSYVPREGAGYQRLEAGLRELYERFADEEGFVQFGYCAVVHRGDHEERTW